MIGVGTVLALNDAGGATFIDIVNVTDIQPPNGSVRTVESKKLSSSIVVRYPTRTDPGMITFKAEFTKAEYNRLAAFRGVSPDKTWRVTHSNADTYSVNGFLVKLNQDSITADEVIHASGEVQLNTLFATVA